MMTVRTASMRPVRAAGDRRHLRLAAFRRRCLTGRRVAVLALVAATVAGLLWGLADVLFADGIDLLGVAVTVAVAVQLPAPTNAP